MSRKTGDDGNSRLLNHDRSYGSTNHQDDGGDDDADLNIPRSVSLAEYHASRSSSQRPRRSAASPEEEIGHFTDDHLTVLLISGRMCAALVASAFLLFFGIVAHLRADRLSLSSQQRSCCIPADLADKALNVLPRVPDRAANGLCTHVSYNQTAALDCFGPCASALHNISATSCSVPDPTVCQQHSAHTSLRLGTNAVLIAVVVACALHLLADFLPEWVSSFDGMKKIGRWWSGVLNTLSAFPLLLALVICCVLYAKQSSRKLSARRVPHGSFSGCAVFDNQGIVALTGYAGSVSSPRSYLEMPLLGCAVTAFLVLSWFAARLVWSIVKWRRKAQSTAV